MTVSYRKFMIIALMTASLLLPGCGDRQDRFTLQQANDALKSGNMKVAIGNTRAVLKKNPRNLYALYLMRKIKSKLYDDAEKSLEAKNYKDAAQKIESFLELDPQNEKAKTLHAEAKKYVHFDDAQKAMAKDNPMAALRLAQEALRLDPQFEEAKKLQAEASEKVERKIATLVETADRLIAEEQFEKLRDLAQDILAIDPQNAEAAKFLREAQAQILVRNKEENLAMARRFYDEGIYESALAKAEEVLKVDPNSNEAMELVQKSKAELSKPDLRLRSITVIKGMQIANIEVPETKEKYMVKEGDVFHGEGDFKVAAVDFDLKAVVVTYVKTGTMQTITMASPD
ncbi:MAG: hypothetical protein Kow0099_22240 [Candidatus Abyssubacteria bacterium]